MSISDIAHANPYEPIFSPRRGSAAIVVAIDSLPDPFGVQESVCECLSRAVTIWLQHDLLVP